MKKLLLFCCCLPMLLQAQTSVSTGKTESDSIPIFVKDSLDGYINQAMKDWNIPGVSVAIVKNGKIIKMKGYGVTELGGQEKVDEHTLFMIGSNTKAFTATLLAMLDNDKKLSLNDKAIKWLPEFKMKDPWITKEVMVRDLLCHRLGMMTFQGDFMFFDSKLSSLQILDKFSRLTPTHGFRTTWGYTNAAFMAGGMIVGRASNSTWEDQLRTKLFQPLGMTRSLALSAEIENATNKAFAHSIMDGKLIKIPYGKLDNIAPAGSISSSANDMSKWVTMQLNNGQLNGKVIVPALAIKETRTPHSILGDGGTLFNKGHFALYGLGWFMEEYGGRKLVSHTGGVNGFVTSVTLIPEEKLGIIVLTNTDQNNFYEALKWDIMDAYLGFQQRNYSKVYLGYYNRQTKADAERIQKLRDTIAMKQPAILPLKDFVGTYENDPYGTLTIQEEGDHLRVKFQHHEMTGKLEAISGNRFLISYSNPIWGVEPIQFTVTNKQVKSITIKVAGFVDYLPYEFKKK